jgi:preprotein translocase subunit SecG
MPFTYDIDRVKEQYEYARSRKDRKIKDIITVAIILLVIVFVVVTILLGITPTTP